MQFSETGKKVITNLLLAFVFVSIGFSLGKHSANTGSVDSRPVAASNSSALAGDSQVKLYYMHAKFRCVTCNSIESMAKEIVKHDFAKALTESKIVWEEVNFQENETLAKKFDVAASCIVVAQIKKGDITGFQRLDEVWTLIEKPDDFNRYISDAVKQALNSINGERK